MNKEQILQNFGLTEAEVHLYITLLTIGESSASDLAKKTNTNRTFTYDRLKKLQESGLLSYVIKDNKKYFKAAPPTQLLAILKGKEEQIQTILPELEKLRQTELKGPQVEIYASKKGIRTALNNILRKKEKILIHGSLNNFEEIMQEYYAIWNKRRENQLIETKVLTTDSLEIPSAIVQLLPEEESSATTTFTCANNTVIVVWSTTPVAIQIQSKEIAQNNRQFFENIWDKEIRIYSGINGVRKAWMELIKGKTKELVGFGFSWKLAQIYGREFSNKWHKERVRNNMTTRLISYDDKNSKKYFDVRMMEWKKFNIQFLDKDLCGPACTTMSDHLIVTFFYTEKKMKVILSKNKEMINTYKKHFETLWKKSTCN
jgi:sugar-specific transcriptional regulator TrmB